MGKEKIKDYIEAVRKKVYRIEPNGKTATLDIVPAYDKGHITFTIYRIGTKTEDPPVLNANEILAQIHEDESIKKLRTEAHEALENLVFPDEEKHVMGIHENAYNMIRVSYTNPQTERPQITEEEPPIEHNPSGTLFEFKDNPNSAAAFNFDKGPYNLNDFIPQTKRLVPPFKTVTSTRLRANNEIMMARGMPNIKMATPQADISERSMRGNNDPTHVYDPCYKSAINKLTKDRPASVTETQINDAMTMLMNPADATVKDKYKITESYNNSLIYENLAKINPELPGYLQKIIREQYGRGIDISEPFSLSSKQNDAGTWTENLIRSLDFRGVMGKGSSYLRGELVSALQYIKDYDGIEYVENPAKPSQFTMFYTRPNTSEKVALFSAETTFKKIKEDKKDDKEKTPEEEQQNRKYTTTFSISKDLPADLYAKAVNQLLTYNVQYSQFTRTNAFPITQLSNDPVKNILLIMTAIGEYHLNVEITDEMREQMERAIANYGPPGSNEVKQMEALWQWVQDRSQIVAGFDTHGHKFINGGVINNLMQKDKASAEELYSLDNVRNVFQNKMQENADLLNLKSREPALEDKEPGVAARLKPT